MEVISIIFVHYGTNEARSHLARRSFKSLYESVKHLKVEMVVIDNGGLDDSQFFLDQVREGKITHYIRNTSNLWFGYARNQGLDISTGQYIAIVDNDLEYIKGWLEDCVHNLNKTKGKKLMATSLEVDRAHIQPKFYRKPVDIDGILHPVNVFAGSNCWVMHREDYEKIGGFINHYIAGTKWCQKYSKMGYGMIIPRKIRALHIGVRYTPYVGYNKNKGVDIVKKYINGEEEILK